MAEFETMSGTSNTTTLKIHNETTLGYTLPCFSPDSTAEKISKICAYSVIFLGGFFGNIFIIIIVYKHRELRKTINYLIVNMAVSDLLVSLLVIPVQITGLVAGSWHGIVRGLLGTILCKCFHFLNPVSLLVSSQSLVWMAIDKFVAVVFPIKTGLISTKIRVIAISSTWILAGVLYFPYLINFRLIQNGNHTYCTNTGSLFTSHEAILAYLWLQLTFSIFAPLFIISILYIAIAVTLKRQSKVLADTAPNMQRHSLKKRRQAIYMAFVIVVMFYICVVPQALFYIMPFTDWRPSCEFLRLCSFLVPFMHFSSCIVNPIICLSFVESYRRGLRNILCPCTRIRNNKMAKRRQITQVNMNDLPEERCRRNSKDPENYDESLETVL